MGIEIDAPPLETPEVKMDEPWNEVLQQEPSTVMEPGKVQINVEVDASGDSAMADYIERVHHAHEYAKVAKTVYEAAKENAKTARTSLELANKELGRIIDKGPEYLPLFDDTEKDQEQDIEWTQPADEPDDAWRDVLLSDAGFPAGLCRLLEENGKVEIRTLRELEDWLSRYHDLTELPKIGQSKADKILELRMAYFAEHGEK